MFRVRSQDQKSRHFDPFRSRSRHVHPEAESSRVPFDGQAFPEPRFTLGSRDRRFPLRVGSWHQRLL
jgi:hypothetical protein